MDQIANTPGPGFFYVLSSPKRTLSHEEYHDWYNYEHGPLRLKLDFMTNGYRYQERGATDGLYLACYDLDKVAGLADPSYTDLRANRSRRESAIVEQGLTCLDRRIYSLFSSRGSAIEPSPVILTVMMIVKRSDVDEIDKWYEEEHLELLSRIPGWRRSRRFRLVWSADYSKDHLGLLAVHEFAESNALGGTEHEQARNTPWRLKAFDKILHSDRKTFDLFHVLDASDYQPPLEGSTEEISSWRIDGNTADDQSPVIAFSNSLLTNFHIWDAAIASLRRSFPTFRFLRYNTRGYDSDPGGLVDVNTLTSDLATLLDHLNIKVCHAVVGVSLGGITTLNFAVKHPDRLKRFIACDCNCTATEANSKAWDERVALALSSNGLAQLANQTIDRWFTTSSTIAQIPGIARVKEMILSASVGGFICCTHALKNVDLRQSVTNIQVPGLCVVGSCDGILPDAMSDFSKMMHQTVCVQVPKSGHLPMVENPLAFVNVIMDFLQ